MASKSDHYEQLKDMSQATVNRIYERLKEKGVRGLKFPERLEVATALTRVNDGDQIVAEERALSNDAGFDDALARLEEME